MRRKLFTLVAFSPTDPKGEKHLVEFVVTHEGVLIRTDGQLEPDILYESAEEALEAVVEEWGGAKVYPR